MDLIYLFLIGTIPVIIILFYFKFRKNQRTMKSIKKHELLMELNTLLKTLEKDTDTKKLNVDKINQIKEEIEKIIDESIENKISEEITGDKIRDTKTKLEELDKNTKKLFLRKDDLIKKVEQEVGKFKIFLDSNVFYPKEFVFTANKLQGKIVDINDSKPNKLNKLLIETEHLLFSFQDEMKQFLNLHNDLKKIISMHNELTGNEKQEIYFHLQQGELEKAKLLIDKYKSKEQKEVSNTLEKK